MAPQALCSLMVDTHVAYSIEMVCGQRVGLRLMMDLSRWHQRLVPTITRPSQLPPKGVSALVKS